MDKLKKLSIELRSWRNVPTSLPTWPLFVPTWEQLVPTSSPTSNQLGQPVFWRANLANLANFVYRPCVSPQTCSIYLSRSDWYWIGCCVFEVSSFARIIVLDDTKWIYEELAYCIRLVHQAARLNQTQRRGGFCCCGAFKLCNVCVVPSGGIVDRI